jgi:hypothetical protein
MPRMWALNLRVNSTESTNFILFSYRSCIFHSFLHSLSFCFIEKAQNLGYFNVFGVKYLLRFWFRLRLTNIRRSNITIIRRSLEANRSKPFSFPFRSPTWSPVFPKNYDCFLFVIFAAVLYRNSFYSIKLVQLVQPSIPLPVQVLVPAPMQPV